MAEKAPTASEALKKLEQQLTCPVCLERYTHPRTLPCLHSFCQDCLARFPVDVQECKQLISCPVCRQTTQLPDKGVSCFQSAFIINSFLELHQLLHKVSGSRQTSCDNCHEEEAMGYCRQCSKFLCQPCVNMHNRWAEFTSHQMMGVEDVAATAAKLIPLKEQPVMTCVTHNKPLEVFCDTCDQLICQLCTHTKQHRNHEFEPLIDSFPKHQKQIVDFLQPIKQKLAAVAATVELLNIQERDILEVGQAVKREIQATVQQLTLALKKSERELTTEVDRLISAYAEKTSARKKKADIAIAQLKSCEEFAEEELRIGSQQQIVVMKRQLVERMKAVCTQVKEEDIQPLEETKLRFVKSTSMLEACTSLGCVVDHSNLKTAVAGRKTSFEITSTNFGAFPSPDLVSCQLYLVADPKVAVRCDVGQVTAGMFEISCLPSVAGLHQLRVQVGEADSFDSPLIVDVMPKQAGQTFTCTGFSYPWGLATTKQGHLVVAVHVEHCITIFNTSNGEKIRSFGRFGTGRAQFSGPSGVAVLPNGHIAVADVNNHSIQVLSAQGAFIAAVGTQGSQPLQFACPRCIASYPNGKLFVTDCDNHRIQVLNHDLSYSHCFGRKGQQPGELNTPKGIAIDSFGMIYIADSENSRVQKFTPEGNWVAIIGRKGKGQLVTPVGLCIDSNDILYVTDNARNTVSMFSTHGHFLGYVGNSDGTSFCTPRYITVDQSGRLFISHKEDEIITY